MNFIRKDQGRIFVTIHSVMNQLPDNVVTALVINTFKSRLNKHWHGHPYKFDPSYYKTDHPTREMCRYYQDTSICTEFE